MSKVSIRDIVQNIALFHDGNFRAELWPRQFLEWANTGYSFGLLLLIIITKEVLAGCLEEEYTRFKTELVLFHEFKFAYRHKARVEAPFQPEHLRDALVPHGITRMSAGSHTERATICHETDARL